MNKSYYEQTVPELLAEKALLEEEIDRRQKQAWGQVVAAIQNYQQFVMSGQNIFIKKDGSNLSGELAVFDDVPGVLFYDTE